MVAMPEGGIQVTSHSRLLIHGHFLFPTLGKPSSAIYGRAAPWANPKPFLFYINFRRCPWVSMPFSHMRCQKHE